MYLKHWRASREHELVSPEHPPIRTDESDVQQVFVISDLAEGGRHVGLEVMPPEAVLLFALDVVCRPHDQLILNQPTDRHVMELLQNKGETLDWEKGGHGMGIICCTHSR